MCDDTTIYTNTIYDPDANVHANYNKSLAGFYICEARNEDFATVFKLIRNMQHDVILVSLITGRERIVAKSQIGDGLDYVALVWIDGRLCRAMLPPPSSN